LLCSQASLPFLSEYWSVRFYPHGPHQLWVIVDCLKLCLIDLTLIIGYLMILSIIHLLRNVDYQNKSIVKFKLVYFLINYLILLLGGLNVVHNLWQLNCSILNRYLHRPTFKTNCCFFNLHITFSVISICSWIRCVPIQLDPYISLMLRWLIIFMSSLGLGLL